MHPACWNEDAIAVALHFHYTRAGLEYVGAILLNKEKGPLSFQAVDGVWAVKCNVATSDIN